MDEVVVESSLRAGPQSFTPFVGKNFELLLTESISHFLHEIKKQNCGFAGFRSIFFRLLQSRPDPPLEIIWFYSAVNFHESRVSPGKAFSMVAAARDLFQFLCACSASCDGAKSIALLAPVMYWLHQALAELGIDHISSKGARKSAKEIECLTEGIIGYISICCSKCETVDTVSTDALSCFKDLVKVWIVDEVDEELSTFLPLVSDPIRDKFRSESCGINYLAAIVMCEAFLVRLCLKLRIGPARPDLPKELKTWAVGALTAFSRCLFFDTSEVAVGSGLAYQNLNGFKTFLVYVTVKVFYGKFRKLQDSEHECILREVLFEVMILVEYPFICPKVAHEQSVDWMKSLALTRLITAHEAVQVARSKGDHGKAIAYINAFSKSQLPSDIIKWVKHQTGIDKPGVPDGFTPQALLKWLLNLEDLKMTLYTNDIVEICSKLSFDEDKVEHEHATFKGDHMKVDDVFIYFDKNGDGQVNEDLEEDQLVQSTDSEFLSAALMMRSTAAEGRKRKEGKKKMERKQVKLLKHNPHTGSAKETLTSNFDDSSGSEIEDPISDKEMQDSDE